jgi:hypothetical protein
MRVRVKPGQWGWTSEDLLTSWQAAEDCGFHHISCFDHVSGSPSRSPRGTLRRCWWLWLGP